MLSQKLFIFTRSCSHGLFNENVGHHILVQATPTTSRVCQSCLLAKYIFFLIKFHSNYLAEWPLMHKAVNLVICGDFTSSHGLSHAQISEPECTPQCCRRREPEKNRARPPECHVCDGRRSQPQVVRERDCPAVYCETGCHLYPSSQQRLGPDVSGRAEIFCSTHENLGQVILFAQHQTAPFSNHSHLLESLLFLQPPLSLLPRNSGVYMS